MIRLLLDLITTGSAFVASLVAVWYKLRAERYRQRWREARQMHDGDGDTHDWEVQLTNGGKHWIVTNGDVVAVKLDTDLEYASLSARARRTADSLASELNSGKIKVAA